LFNALHVRVVRSLVLVVHELDQAVADLVGQRHGVLGVLAGRGDLDGALRRVGLRRDPCGQRGRVDPAGLGDLGRHVPTGGEQAHLGELRTGQFLSVTALPS
jgi:hypothetical protein